MGSCSNKHPIIRNKQEVRRINQHDYGDDGGGTATATSETVAETLLHHLSRYRAEEFSAVLISREDWAKRIGISRTTVWRWERFVIEEEDIISFLYYDINKRKNKPKLDGYQRFFIVLLDLFKRGVITGKPMSYEEITTYLLSVPQGAQQEFYTYIRRKNFKEWINAK